MVIRGLPSMASAAARCHSASANARLIPPRATAWMMRLRARLACVSTVATGKTTGLHTIRCRHCGKQIGGGEARLVQTMWERTNKDTPHDECAGDA